MFSQARLVSRTVWDKAAMVQWAADCAEHVLSKFESKYPGDDRPRKAIEAARSGNTDAARSAADAARSAARSATYAAYSAADAAYSAANAADAAYSAAYSAANAADAAYSAVDAERGWQIERLGYYLRGEHLQ